MSQPWPPPPDLDSIKELVRDADTEEFIKLHGAPADEYDREAEDLHKAIAFFETAEITVPRLLPTIRSIWQRSFDYSDAQLALAEPEFQALAEQIARFFGPEAKPQVRNA